VLSRIIGTPNSGSIGVIKIPIGRRMKPTRSLFDITGFYTKAKSPAYRATLLLIRWAQVKTALTFLHFCWYKFLQNQSQIKGFLWGNHGQIWAVIWAARVN